MIRPEFFVTDCSICSKTYVSGTSFSCRKCSDRAIAITIVAILVVLATVIGLATVSYLVSAEGVGSGRGIMKVIMSRVPTQSVKIVIVVWQILTQVRVATAHDNLAY